MAPLALALAGGKVQAMATKIAINGFGRIGRCIVRAMYERGVKDLELVAIGRVPFTEGLGLEAPDREENLNEQNDRHGDPARGSEPIDSTSFFGLQVKEHDNEKKKHHYRARINQNLNDADKIGVE